MFEHLFVVGAQRAGTTYLYHLLAEHPEIEMASPVRPEPKFFLLDASFRRGLSYYESTFFGTKADAWLRGEKSTSYMESEKAARRIAECFPSARVLFILRDPIERAISNYWFSVSNGLETMPMSDAFLHENERVLMHAQARVSVSPYAYLRRGLYVDYISMYERLFPPSNMKILLHEEFVGSITLAQELYAFLGVAPGFIPSAFHQVFNKGEKGDSTLAPDLEDYLMQYFAESNERLATRYDMNLAEWRSS